MVEEVNILVFVLVCLYLLLAPLAGCILFAILVSHTRSEDGARDTVRQQ